MGDRAETPLGVSQFEWADDDVEDTELMDEILFSSGGYVSKRRVGYLIISPERGLVIFAQAG